MYSVHVTYSCYCLCFPFLLVFIVISTKQQLPPSSPPLLAIGFNFSSLYTSSLSLPLITHHLFLEKPKLFNKQQLAKSLELMMPSFHSHHKLLFLLLLFFISSHTSTAGRFLLQKQGKEEMNLLDGFSQTSHISKLEEKETWKLMGVEEEEEEECDHNGDEESECLKRRIISEAHLDYIYTQHHKP